MNDPLYQIFSVTVSWMQEDVTDRCYHHFVEMPKLNTSLGDMEEWARWVWWQQYQPLSKLPIINPTDIQVTVRYCGHASWCLGWFFHWTHNVGQEQTDIIGSFYRYVWAKVDANRLAGRDEGHGLMGAHESYRWSGKYDDAGNRTRPPCQCDGCKRLGIFRIIH